jgi:hypothetical protein
MVYVISSINLPGFMGRLDLLLWQLKGQPPAYVRRFFHLSDISVKWVAGEKSYDAEILQEEDGKFLCCKELGYRISIPVESERVFQLVEYFFHLKESLRANFPTMLLPGFKPGTS